MKQIKIIPSLKDGEYFALVDDEDYEAARVFEDFITDKRTTHLQQNISRQVLQTFPGTYIMCVHILTHTFINM